MIRLLVFTDSNGPVSAAVTERTLALVDAAPDLEVCGIVVANPKRFRPSRRTRATRALRHALVAATNADVPYRRPRPRRLDLAALEPGRGIPTLVPPSGDPNDPAFRDRLTREVRPDVALSYYCLRIFKRPLLDVFEQTVNFHNGLLPHYKGISATSFSMYNGEQRSGFTFHRMTEAVDAGPILVQDAVPVADHDTITTVTRRMTAAAVAGLPTVLELVRTGAPGRPQEGPGSYYSRRDAEAVVYVAEPGLLTAAELQRRLRAFGTVSLLIGDALYPVTRLRPARPGERLAFRTADSASLAPDRVAGLPVFLYRLSGLRARARR